LADAKIIRIRHASCYGRCFALIDNDFRFSVVQPLANFYRPMALLQHNFCFMINSCFRNQTINCQYLFLMQVDLSIDNVLRLCCFFLKTSIMVLPRYAVTAHCRENSMHLSSPEPWTVKKPPAEPWLIPVGSGMDFNTELSYQPFVDYHHLVKWFCKLFRCSYWKVIGFDNNTVSCWNNNFFCCGSFFVPISVLLCKSSRDKKS
jgi:hypothetical protein